jgi:hypothetical protein
MLRKTIFASLLASSALSLAIATPAAAGKTDRAREAIAAAEAKIHTAENLGAPESAPRDIAEARAALATAKEDFDSHHREDAIRVAIHAQAMADTAIGIAQQHKNAAIASAREAQRESDAAARDQVAAARGEAAEAAAQAQGQVNAAREQAAQAQQQAADANARAAAAEQAAAASAADAEAARAAAAAIQTPQVETTVTTRHSATAHRRHATRTTVRRHTSTTHSTAPGTASSDEVTTTTKVVPR